MRHVIGFGNPLHGDDGVAAAVCAALSATALPPDVRVFDAGTRGLDALALLTGCDEAILVDAAWPAGRAGEIRCPDPAEVVPEGGLAWHAGGVGALLQALPLCPGTPPRLRLVTIEAERRRYFEPGLSPPVAAAVAGVVSLLRGYLEDGR